MISLDLRSSRAFLEPMRLDARGLDLRSSSAVLLGRVFFYPWSQPYVRDSVESARRP